MPLALLGYNCLDNKTISGLNSSWYYTKSKISRVSIILTTQVIDTVGIFTLGLLEKSNPKLFHKLRN